MIKILVKAEARKNQIKEIKPDVFEVSVKEKPQGGEANEAIRDLLADHFKVPTTQVRILTGRKSPHKKVEIKFK